MTRMPGDWIDKVWKDLRRERARRSIVVGLAQYLEQPCVVKGTFVGSINGTPTCEPLCPPTILPTVVAFRDLLVDTSLRLCPLRLQGR